MIRKLKFFNHLSIIRHVEDLGIKKRATNIAFPIIVEGKIYHNYLEWINQQLKMKGIPNYKSENKILHVTSKHELHVDVPRIYH
ncbi:MULTISPECIES: hypothetical protein [Bacillaceae]|uniref:DUF421 domain-containing protein n=1 Tax=Evansella alkalicola TaxID=745819 RepID=A0ABS6JWA3_9BACI|nr:MULTISPECIES: hypothetical protein [Bacillaceae]MBU9722863.1 DUF421 domain-containing protein [Bacillus alkalicola]